MKNKLRLMFIGSMTNPLSGGNFAFGQILANQLKEEYSIVIASYKYSKFGRIIDIANTIFIYRKKIDLIILQVYSGLNFVIVDIASWIGQLFKIPMIFHVHGGNIPLFMKEHRSWVNLVFRRAKIFVTPTDYLRIPLEKLNYCVTCIPNYININEYNYINRNIVKPKIIWLRAFHKIYNPSLAPTVIAKLNGHGIQSSLTMLGPDIKDGSLAETQRIIYENLLENKVTIQGAIQKSDVPNWLAKSDIFINTTNIDNTPISILEAMASGLCVVSTNVGGLPYLIENDVDGLLVPPNDPDSMATAIIRILTEPGLAEKLSTNARKKAEQFDWSNVLPLWENLFQVVLQHK